MANKPARPSPLRVPREAVAALLEAARWIGNLNGTDDPKGKQELREEVAKAAAALGQIRAALSATS